MMNIRRACSVLALATCAWLAGCDPAGTVGQDETKDPHFQTAERRKAAFDYKGAIESYERALENNPRSAAAHFELALLYEKQEQDPATAIYHYGRFLRLRPASSHADLVNQRIAACKMELAASTSYSPDTTRISAEVSRLMDENKRLKIEVEQLRIELASRPTNYVLGTPTPPPVAPLAGGPTAPPARSNAAPPSPSTPRTHKVRPNETLSSIAKQHNVSLSSLQSANPGVVAERLKIGQELKLPASR
jgi:LysM repeat protein